MASDQDFSTAQLYFSKMPLVLRPLAYTQQALQQEICTLKRYRRSQHAACSLHPDMRNCTRCIAIRASAVPGANWKSNAIRGRPAVRSGMRQESADLVGGWEAHAPYCRQASQCTHMNTQANSWMIWRWNREMLATSGLLLRSCTAPRRSLFCAHSPEPPSL